jgi:hypothetical protein
MIPCRPGKGDRRMLLLTLRTSILIGAEKLESPGPRLLGGGRPAHHAPLHTQPPLVENRASVGAICRGRACTRDKISMPIYIEAASHPQPHFFLGGEGGGVC